MLSLEDTGPFVPTIAILGSSGNFFAALRKRHRQEEANMKKPKSTVVFVALLSGVLGALAYGQENTITVGDVPLTVRVKAFVTTPVAPLQSGARLPARFIMGSGTSSVWSVRTYGFAIGGRMLQYPVHGIVKCPGASSGCSFGVIASTTVFTEGIRPGQVIHSGGYLIEAKRAIKAGEAIATLLLLRDKVFSITSVEAMGEGGEVKPQPWLAIFDERLKPSDRTLASEAWRISNDTVKFVSSLPPGLRLQ